MLSACQVSTQVRGKKSKPAERNGRAIGLSKPTPVRAVQEREKHPSRGRERERAKMATSTTTPRADPLHELKVRRQTVRRPVKAPILFSTTILSRSRLPAPRPLFFFFFFSPSVVVKCCQVFSKRSRRVCGQKASVVHEGGVDLPGAMDGLCSDASSYSTQRATMTWRSNFTNVYFPVYAPTSTLSFHFISFHFFFLLTALFHTAPRVSEHSRLLSSFFFFSSFFPPHGT